MTHCDTIDGNTWDSFLETTLLGQFQQSSKWARVKALEGWRAYREAFADSGGISGGYQILWKPTRLGKIGYVSKGPVLRAETADRLEGALRRVCESAKQLALAGLIVQPPDFSSMGVGDLRRKGFSGATIPGVIRSTLLVEMRGAPGEVDRGLSQTMRNEARQAGRKGVIVCEGTRTDLPMFFELMLETCRRQESPPNPSKLELLLALWDELQPRVHLRFAKVKDEIVAGLLLIAFGDRLTLWKKGWNSVGGKNHPNSLLHVDAIKWAASQGFRYFDFVGLDLEIAEALLENRLLTEAQQRSRHMFHIRLGAQAKILPPAQLLVVNPAFRILFEASTRLPLLQSAIQMRLSRI